MTIATLYESTVDKQPPLVGVYGDMNGLRVLIATRAGKPVAVSCESVSSDLDTLMTPRLMGFVNRTSTLAWVSIDGQLRSVRLLPLEDFFNFCMQVHDPRLDAFRARLSAIAASVQGRGGYISPQSDYRAFLPPELEGNANATMLAVLMDQERKTAALREEVQQVREEVRDVQKAIGRGRDHITLSNWLEYHGVRTLTAGEMTSEGQKLLKVCRRIGVTVPDKIIGDGNHLVRPWPRAVYEEWWPDFCRRTGRPLEWRA